ncbi:transposase [Ectothiorhodospira sp. PHS-1]|uniref:IS630 family transposase n=1 Tax=Ectothiorhodospira sp. PHS-1 TaxID=519989 RepID=UPI00024A89AE|nr:IS630 family transposase [Ectothiorhodospira sp. PHS-1]EHQ52478.1 transposase [Ectothiorhodospira sp. PHS-1]
MEVPDAKETDRWIGVDRGQNVPAVAATPDGPVIFWKAKQIRHVRRIYAHRRRKLQKAGKHRAVKKLESKEGKAEIHWGDETGLRSDCQHVRGYAPKGQAPVLRQNAKRASINLISTITNRGKVRFRIYEGTMHAGLLIDFMKRLVKSCDQKIFLILDNLRVHHAYKVRDWLSDHKDEIEVFYLPPYSPELNPDEYLKLRSQGWRS